MAFGTPSKSHRNLLAAAALVADIKPLRWLLEQHLREHPKNAHKICCFSSSPYFGNTNDMLKEATTGSLYSKLSKI